MTKKQAEATLADWLEDTEAIREQAASLERLRGVLVTRFRKHPNMLIMANACHRQAQKYMAEFDRCCLAMLNQAWPTTVDDPDTPPQEFAKLEGYNAEMHGGEYERFSS